MLHLKTRKMFYFLITEADCKTKISFFFPFSLPFSLSAVTVVNIPLLLLAFTHVFITAN